MKTLKDIISEKLSIDSISEKLSIDSISLNVDLSKFPVDGTGDEISKYLDKLDFKEIKMPDSWHEIQDEFKNVKCSTYMHYEDRYGGFTFVILVDSNSHSRDLFIIINTRVKRNYIIFYDIENKKFHNINDAVKVSKEEWLEEINK